MHKGYYTEVFKEICYEEGRTCYNCSFFLGVNSLEVEIQPISETHYKSKQYNRMNVEMLAIVFHTFVLSLLKLEEFCSLTSL